MVQQTGIFSLEFCPYLKEGLQYTSVESHFQLLATLSKIIY